MVSTLQFKSSNDVGQLLSVELGLGPFLRILGEIAAAEPLTLDFKTRFGC